jgi:hypothetical protein
MSLPRKHGGQPVLEDLCHGREDSQLVINQVIAKRFVKKQHIRTSDAATRKNWPHSNPKKRLLSWKDGALDGLAQARWMARVGRSPPSARQAPMG